MSTLSLQKRHKTVITTVLPQGGGLDKVMRCDKNVDESANLRIQLFSVELIFVLSIAVWCSVYIGKSKPEGINSSVFDFCVLQKY